MTTDFLSPETHSAADVVRLLELQPLEREGGFFRRTAEGPVAGMPATAAAAGGVPRRAWSAIYAFFTPDGFSALHRLAVDEVWCFHAGDPLESLRLYPDGGAGWVRLGPGAAGGGHAQEVVPRGVWQGTRLVAGGRWALVSCVCVPAFRWEDFEAGRAAELAAQYPSQAAAIATLCR